MSPSRRVRPSSVWRASLLDAAPSPWLCVPGSHDRPWSRQQRIHSGWSDSLGPTEAVVSAADGSWTAAGIDSSRPLRWRAGAVGAGQRAALRESLLAANGIRIAALHHPLGGSVAHELIARVGGLDDVVSMLTEVRVDLVLTGHHHRFRLDDLADLGRRSGWHAVVSGAGTATAWRVRGEPQGYNLVDIDKDDSSGVIRLQRRWWTGARFETESARTWHLEVDGWLPGRI